MIGLSTYAFFWRWNGHPRPHTLARMLTETRQLEAELLQICDYPMVEALSERKLRDLRALADDLGVRLELGTRGILPDHLEKYRSMAEVLGVQFVRTMLHTVEHKPSVAEAVELLRPAVQRYADSGVTLGLETYEQVSTRDLIEVVTGVDMPSLGVCLDPANSVARLEFPDEVVAACAPHVVNMHIKDFTFTRQAGWVGFSLIGCPLGTGMLDYAAMVRAVRPWERGISQVVEHWLPRGDSLTATCELEREWTEQSVTYLQAAERERATATPGPRAAG